MFKLAKLEPNDKYQSNVYMAYISFSRLHSYLLYLRDQHTTLMYWSWAVIAFSGMKIGKTGWAACFFFSASCSSIDCHASLPMVMMIMYTITHLSRSHPPLRLSLPLAACLLINFELKLCGISSTNYKGTRLFASLAGSLTPHSIHTLYMSVCIYAIHLYVPYSVPRKCQ